MSVDCVKATHLAVHLHIQLASSSIVAVRCQKAPCTILESIPTVTVLIVNF